MKDTASLQDQVRKLQEAAGIMPQEEGMPRIDARPLKGNELGMLKSRIEDAINDYLAVALQTRVGQKPLDINNAGKEIKAFVDKIINGHIEDSMY